MIKLFPLIAKPADISAPEPEAEFVTTLPDNDLPSKPHRTNLETSEQKSKKENEIIESKPDLKRKPSGSKENKKITLGKDKEKGTRQGTQLKQYFGLKNDYDDDDDNDDNDVAKDEIHHYQLKIGLDTNGYF